MATNENEYYKNDKLKFGRLRSIIETAFYGNNVTIIDTLKNAYKIAKNTRGAIITDIPVYKSELLGLNKDTKILLFNNDSITGRCNDSRYVVGKDNINYDNFNKMIMDVVYKSRLNNMYHVIVYIGLDIEFIIKAHLLIPKEYGDIIYSWMLNFQYMSCYYNKLYKQSKLIGNGIETDIYIFAYPQWTLNDDHYNCVKKSKSLCYFDTNQNCACILGMKYFGEYKKSTLTLAWAIANRNNYISCHGGEKEYILRNGSKHVIAVYGLSGSGKSTIINFKHNNKYKINVLHDDSFIINTKTCDSLALESSYFDKTQNYNNDKFTLVSINNAVVLDNNKNIQLMTKDIRNDNGRAIKSRFLIKNRVNKIKNNINSIFWIMKNSVLPPVLKLNDSILAATMGAILTTKHSTAENNINLNETIVVPYANPFRTYCLIDDYNKFEMLIRKNKINCYIINTSDFMGINIKPNDTLNILENIIEEKAIFKQWLMFSSIEILNIKKFNICNHNYLNYLKLYFKYCINIINTFNNNNYNALPNDALRSIKKLLTELNNF